MVLAKLDAGAIADYELDLARLLWDVPVDGGRARARARRLVEQARAAFAESGPAWSDSLAEAETWLAER